MGTDHFGRACFFSEFFFVRGSDVLARGAAGLGESSGPRCALGPVFYRDGLGASVFSGMVFFCSPDRRAGSRDGVPFMGGCVLFQSRWISVLEKGSEVGMESLH